MDDLPEFSEQKARSQQIRVEFLQADLALCHTFADLAKTEFELNDQIAVQRLFAKAEAGYATIARSLLKLDDPEQRKEIQQRVRAASHPA